MLLIKVADGIQRMQEQHSRPRVAHRLFNFLSHILFVTVNRTISTGWFLFTKRTSLQSLQRVFPQLFACPAQLFPWESIFAVGRSAMNSDHFTYNFFLSLVHPFFFITSISINEIHANFQNVKLTNFLLLPKLCYCFLVVRGFHFRLI